MIVRAPEPDVDIPDVPLTPLLLARADALGDKPALIDGPSGRTWTYAQWAGAVRAAAAGLAGRGFAKGDVLAIFSPNLPEYAVAFHAASLIGGIVTTINPLYTAAELRYQLKDAGARDLITVGPFLEKARQAAAECSLRETFVFGEADGATPFSSLLAGGGVPPVVPIDPREDLVAMPYSSGTTGLSKGVMLTHRNLVANMVQAEASFDALTRDDRVIAILPFFHIYGLVVVLNLGLYMGATVVTLPRFEMESFLSTLQTYRISYANVVPPIVLGLAKHPLVEKFDLSSLRIVFSGAAPLGADLAAAASARLGARVLQGYGLTETSPVTHAVRAGRATPASAGSVGPPLPNTEAKVVHVSTGAELDARQEGEICVRGPQVMKGYLNRPDATAAMIDPDGWLHTGDIGYFDEEGSFFIVDRVKELIKYKGLQVAPAELEAVLISHPAVADAAVIPIADDEAGQVPKGFVVLKGQATAAEIMAYVADRVAPFKKLRYLEVVDQIPKSPSGKILRRLLVDREREARS